MSEKDRSLFIPILHRPLFSWSGVLINSLENSLTLSRMNHMNPRIEAENYYGQPRHNIIVLSSKGTQIRNDTHKTNKIKKHRSKSLVVRKTYSFFDFYIVTKIDMVKIIERIITNFSLSIITPMNY